MRDNLSRLMILSFLSLPCFLPSGNFLCVLGIQDASDDLAWALAIRWLGLQETPLPKGRRFLGSSAHAGGGRADLTLGTDTDAAEMARNSKACFGDTFGGVPCNLPAPPFPLCPSQSLQVKPAGGLLWAARGGEDAGNVVGEASLQTIQGL